MHFLFFTLVTIISDAAVYVMTFIYHMQILLLLLYSVREINIQIMIQVLVWNCLVPVIFVSICITSTS